MAYTAYQIHSEDGKHAVGIRGDERIVVLVQSQYGIPLNTTNMRDARRLRTEAKDAWPEIKWEIVKMSKGRRTGDQIAL